MADAPLFYLAPFLLKNEQFSSFFMLLFGYSDAFFRLKKAFSIYFFFHWGFST